MKRSLFHRMTLPGAVLAWAWAVAVFCIIAAGSVSAAEPMRLYIGTYTGGESRGIYQYRFDADSGELTAVGLAAEAANPSFLAAHPSGRFLYAVNEIGGPERAGAVSAFAIDGEDGGLTPMNDRPTRGAGPCHLVVDPTGLCVIAANYGGGSTCAFPIGEDGRLGEGGAFIQHEGSSVNPRRQRGPHAHCVTLGPANRFAFVTDLGLDQILIFRLDPAAAMLAPHEPAGVSVAPGAGPRHFAFHPGGRFAYVINELDSTVTAFEYEGQRGALRDIQTLSTLPAGFEGNNSTAEIEAHPSGRFVYGSNRGHDSIAIFAVDEASGRLRLIGHQPTLGRTPRNFKIDPTGRYLLAANQNSDTIAVFRIDQSSGRLSPVGEPVSAPTPVCVTFVPGR